MTNKELAILQGYQVLSFDEMKKQLNELGYDITTQYVKSWRCSNTWNDLTYYSTGCVFLGTNIGFANVEGNEIRNSISKEKQDAFRELRGNTYFIIGNDLYSI